MSAAISVVHPPGYDPERAYIANVVFGEFLGLDVEVAEARVSEWELRCNGGVVTLPDVLFRTRPEDWLTRASLPANGALYGDDLLGNAFFMLTRYEEVAQGDRDAHGRFPAEASVAVRGDFAERPIVNEAVEKIWELVAEIAPRLERRKRRFRNLPSHDVDFASATLAHRVQAALSGKVSSLLPRNPFDTFDLIMKASERHGVQSAFYFMTRDAPYSLADPGIRRLLRTIHARGHEIGFHASYDAFGDAERTREEFEQLLVACEREGIHQDRWGGRAHYLRWDPATWGTWDSAGLAYDSSVGFSSRPGFRAGVCYEYPVFDLIGRRALALRERPLVVMDNPALGEHGSTYEELVSRVRAIRGECERFDGDFTNLWHNSWIITRRRQALLEVALAA